APFENRLNCPQECAAGQRDRVCDAGDDAAEDGICDQDCIVAAAPFLSLSKDPDCRLLPTQSPFVESDCQTTCFDGFRYDCERTVSGEEIWSRSMECVWSCEQGCAPPDSARNRKIIFPCVEDKDCVFIQDDGS